MDIAQGSDYGISSRSW